MRLLLVALTALSIAFGLSGCGKKGDLDPPPNRPDEEAATTL